MKCPSCGAETVADGIYCPKCGQRLEAPATGAPGAPNAADATADGPPPADPDGPRMPKQQFQQALQSSRDVEHDVEEELWTGGYSPKAMTGTWVLLAAVSVAVVVLGIWQAGAHLTAWLAIAGGLAAVWLASALLLAYRRFSVHYRLTNQRFIHREGLLTHKTDRIEVIDVNDVTFRQGIIERMLGIGSIRIDSADRSHPEYWMHGIDQVQEVAHLLDQARRLERRRRGLHIETT